MPVFTRVSGGKSYKVHSEAKLRDGFIRNDIIYNTNLFSFCYAIVDVVQLGAGSAYGGNWAPKKEEDQRFLGESGRIIRTEDKYVKDTKIGEDGRAIMERHYTDHFRADKHSDPHDHEINWAEDGSPRLGPPIILG